MIAYQILGAVVGTILVLTDLLLIKSLGDEYHYCLHCIEQETAAQRGQVTCPRLCNY